MKPQNYCDKCKKPHDTHIHVNLPNDTGVTIPFGPNCTTVLDIKHFLRDTLGIHPELQLLARDRQILENERTLGFYDISTTMEVDFWLLAPKTPLKCPPKEVQTRDERFAECADLLENFGTDLCKEVAAMCFRTMETLQQILWWQREQLNTWATSVSSATTLLEIVIVMQREMDRVFQRPGEFTLGDIIALWTLLLVDENSRWESTVSAISPKAITMYAAVTQIFEEAKITGSSGYGSGSTLPSDQTQSPASDTVTQNRVLRTAVLHLKQ
ncbi:hypothetical protein Ddc_17082 [Ditylenchus destructor]|nr:hypothetical protein Ddc_17082 [Ditylenchus destructor]